MDQSYQSLTMGMGVFCCNTAMGCPAGMADAAVGRAVAFLFYKFFLCSYLSYSLDQMDL